MMLDVYYFHSILTLSSMFTTFTVWTCRIMKRKLISNCFVRQRPPVVDSNCYICSYSNFELVFELQEHYNLVMKIFPLLIDAVACV